MTMARALAALPPSPLAAFRAGIGQCLRTGLNSTFESSALSALPAAEAVRLACRSGAHGGPTAGLAPGAVQANLVAVPREHAFEFTRFCLLNPRPCPLLCVAPTPTGAGGVAAGADLRTDLPAYVVWRDGTPGASASDASAAWAEADLVAFLLGCSFSWEGVLADAGHEPRHVAAQSNVPMYRTSVENARAGPFGGRLVVSMRPYAPDAIGDVARITGAYPAAHGAPVHWGDPAALGIGDLASPDYGDAVAMNDGEVPVFWACGVTPQSALADAGLPLAVTHAPGHMLVCDLEDAALLT